jgi:multicomponent K+:H+ antiporter subunit E
MTRLIHRLTLPAVLLVLWLMLNDTLAPGHILLGSALALALSWAARALRPLHANARNPAAILRLTGHVMVDVARSNLMVARIVLLGRKAGATPGYIRIPLQLRNPHALAALACIVTFTPGTVWSDFSEQDGILTLHVLDLKEETQWLELIHNRYERPLKEIFE